MLELTDALVDDPTQLLAHASTVRLGDPTEAIELVPLDTDARHGEGCGGCGLTSHTLPVVLPGSYAEVKRTHAPLPGWYLAKSGIAD